MTQMLVTRKPCGCVVSSTEIAIYVAEDIGDRVIEAAGLGHDVSIETRERIGAERCPEHAGERGAEVS